MQPPGQVVPNIGRVGVRIGKPLDFSRYEGMSRDRYILRSVTDEIMYEILALSEQEYVDVYADRMKQQLAEAKAQAKTEAKAEAKEDAKIKAQVEAEAEAKAEAATRADDEIEPVLGEEEAAG